MDRAELGQLYRSESRDYLDALGRAMLGLERGDGRSAIDEAFRVVHTLKGMSAAMGYQPVVTLAHGVEHMLERLRSGLLDVDREMIEMLYQAVDQLDHVIEDAWRADEASGFDGAAPGGGGGRRSTPDDASRAAEIVASRFVRVEQDRIDRLVDRAGELIVARERLMATLGAAADDETRAITEELGRGILDLREDAFSLRLAPIAEVFERLRRLTRETARNLGKTVRLEITGEYVEIDRALIGDLADLMTHLLRNALDHGVETPAEREAKGKSDSGTVWISATADLDTVTVQVADDGRGIDLDAISRKAVADGLRQPEGEPRIGTEELFDLLTRPGFSTATTVTEVSGRGVGLDRVASRLRDLGGNLEIETRAGAGATFTLRIPKTLSLTRVLLVSCGSETLALPSVAVDRVEEYGRPAMSGRLGQADDQHATVSDLAKLMGLRHPDKVVTEGFVVVLVAAGRRHDLLVDRLIGLKDVVVKRFAIPRQVMDLYAGATILPDGHPCLVLQPGRLLSIQPAAGAPGSGASSAGATTT